MERLLGATPASATPRRAPLDATVEAQLVAYVVPPRRRARDAGGRAARRVFGRRCRLLIPASIVVLDALPLTARASSTSTRSRRRIAPPRWGSRPTSPPGPPTSRRWPRCGPSCSHSTRSASMTTSSISAATRSSCSPCNGGSAGSGARSPWLTCSGSPPSGRWPTPRAAAPRTTGRPRGRRGTGPARQRQAMRRSSGGAGR